MMSGEPSASPAALIRERVAANLRSCRAWVKFSQANVAGDMRALGFGQWTRQTVGEVEAGKRGLKVEEIHGLAEILGTTPEILIRVPRPFATAEQSSSSAAGPPVLHR